MDQAEPLPLEPVAAPQLPADRRGRWEPVEPQPTGDRWQAVVADEVGGLWIDGRLMVTGGAAGACYSNRTWMLLSGDPSP